MEVEYGGSDLFIGLGSNKGDRRLQLSHAVSRLSAVPGGLYRQSSIYETQPWGNTAQDAFLNQVIWCKVKQGDPLVLLRALQETEAALGRTRTEKWGPREIDIDILYWGDLIYSSSMLQVPHPEIRNRMFVLAPLAEIAAGFMDPVLGLDILEMKNRCTDSLQVEVCSMHV